MRKIILYIACSLNGKIARKGGSVDWLEAIPNPENSDHGYAEFYASIDTTIQGFSTYDQIIGWGIEFPYAGKKNYVLSSKQDLKDNQYVSFITANHLEKVREIKAEVGKGIWLIGGGKTNTLLLNAGLIDEIRIFIMPHILPEGIDVFELLPKEYSLNLEGSKSYSSGAIELIYSL